MSYVLTFYRDRQKDWRWRLVARNGRVVANAGEGYRRRTDCVGIAERLFSHLEPRFELPQRPIEPGAK